VSELQQKVQSEAQKVKQEQQRVQELHGQIKKLEADCNKAEQQWSNLDEASTKTLKETEAKHVQTLDQLKQLHARDIDGLKEHHEHRLVESRKTVEKAASEHYEKELRSARAKFVKEKTEIWQKKQAESEKLVKLNETIHNLKEQHVHQLKLREQRAEQELLSLQQSLTASSDKNINALRSKVSQLQSENQDLEIPVIKSTPKDTLSSATQENVVTKSNVSLKCLDAVHASTKYPDIRPETNREKMAVKVNGSDISKSQNRPCSSMSLKRIWDLATELEPNTSRELNTELHSAHKHIDELLKLDTPSIGQPLTEDQRHQFSLALSSESGFGELIQEHEDPFVIKNAKTAKKLDPTLSVSSYHDSKSSAIPFKMPPNLNQEFRSSVPPSTSGSMGSVSVLAMKAGDKGQLLRAAEPRESKRSNTGIILGKAEPRSSTKASTIMLSSSRGKKRSFSGISYTGIDEDELGHAFKKIAPGREIRNIHRHPTSNIKTYGTRSNFGPQEAMQTRTAIHRFTVVGEPHVGKHAYNRPPTAKSGGGRSRRVLNKSSQYVMMARFDEELRR
jgi:hypothetical protein